MSLSDLSVLFSYSIHFISLFLFLSVYLHITSLNVTLSVSTPYFSLFQLPFCFHLYFTFYYHFFFFLFVLPFLKYFAIFSLLPKLLFITHISHLNILPRSCGWGEGSHTVSTHKRVGICSTFISMCLFFYANCIYV